MIAKLSHRKAAGFTVIETVIALSLLLIMLFSAYRMFSLIFSAQNDETKSLDLIAIGQYLNSHLSCKDTLKEWKPCDEKTFIPTFEGEGQPLTLTNGTKIQNFKIRAYCEQRNVNFEYEDGVFGWKRFPLSVYCRSHLELLLSFDGVDPLKEESQNSFNADFRRGEGSRNKDFFFSSYKSTQPRLKKGVIGRSLVLDGAKGEHLVVPHHDNFLSDEFTILAYVKLRQMEWNPQAARTDYINIYENKRTWSLFTKDHNNIKNSGHIWLKFFQKVTSEPNAYLTARYQNEISLEQNSFFLGEMPSIANLGGSNIAVPIDQWTHIAFSSTEEALKLYVNGELVETLRPDKSNFEMLYASIGTAVPDNVRFSGTQDNSCYVPICAQTPLAQCNSNEQCVYFEGACHSYCYGNREPMVFGANTHRNSENMKASYGPEVGDPNNLYLDEFFDGEMDQLSFWSRALSEEEVKEIYHKKAL